MEELEYPACDSGCFCGGPEPEPEPVADPVGDLQLISSKVSGLVSDLLCLDTDSLAPIAVEEVTTAAHYLSLARSALVKADLWQAHALGA